MGEIIFGVIIVALIVERYFFAKEMTARLGDATKAVMSRNINEYLSATTVPTKRSKEPEVDEVELSGASEKEFDSFIDKINS